MKRTAVTYGQLDKVLRSLGFSAHATKHAPPGRIYKHTTGAVIMLPEFSPSEHVFEHHLVAARLELYNFSLAEPSVFAAKLQRAG
jgi:hypothetical protein